LWSGALMTMTKPSSNGGKSLQETNAPLELIFSISPSTLACGVKIVTGHLTLALGATRFSCSGIYTSSLQDCF
jgi:hypothetical protein